MAGELILREAKKSGAEILPVDSEHSAIHQAMRCGRPEEVGRIVLTASGGPFRERDLATFDAITVEDALAHPTWKMGPKITIDSATMMNKGLEIIEAHFLFGLPVGADRRRAPSAVGHPLVRRVRRRVAHRAARQERHEVPDRLRADLPRPPRQRLRPPRPRLRQEARVLRGRARAVSGRRTRARGAPGGRNARRRQRGQRDRRGGVPAGEDFLPRDRFGGLGDRRRPVPCPRRRPSRRRRRSIEWRGAGPRKSSTACPAPPSPTRTESP